MNKGYLLSFAVEHTIHKCSGLKQQPLFSSLFGGWRDSSLCFSAGLSQAHSQVHHRLLGGGLAPGRWLAVDWGDGGL